MNLGLIIVVALTLALLGGAAWLWSMARGKERYEGAMSRMGTREEAAPVLFTPDSPELRIPGVKWASQLLWRAGYETQPRRVAVLSGGLLLTLLFILLVANLVAALMIDIIVLLLVYVVLTRRAAARRSLIVEQLPGYVDRYLGGEIKIDEMITEVLPLEDINKAFDLMHEGKVIRSVIRF